MFTWICPTCGKEWDLSVKDCPGCRDKPTPSGGALRDRGGAEPAPVAPTPRSDRRFWVLLAAATAIGVVGLVLWVRFQGRRPATQTVSKTETPQPGGSSTPALEPIPEPAATVSGAPRDMEVAGIRMAYDSQDKPQVRALVINHGDEELRDVALAVTLRPAESAADSPPLARFQVKIGPVLRPGESREVKAPLETFATLAAMPPWHKLRADVERR